MKHFMIATAVAATTAATLTFAADVGVSVGVGQPGFYGRIDIGGYPPPQVIYRQPMIIERVSNNRPPIYLRVPPGHAQKWSKHCHEYNACGERVFFVQDNWYNHEYVPRYQEQYRDRRDERGDKYKDDKRKGEKNKDDKRGNHKIDRRGTDQDPGPGRDRDWPDGTVMS